MVDGGRGWGEGAVFLACSSVPSVAHSLGFLRAGGRLLPLHIPNSHNRRAFVIQGQVGHGSEQPGLVEDVLAHCKGAGLDDL